MKLEICANSYRSAMNAQNAGAHRIELCSELSIGGITPSYGLLKKIAKEISIPVHVLIRPRSGNFCYSDEEFQIMKKDIIACKKLGFSGIVSGILNADDTIDIKRTEKLIALAKPLTFTFHRAFDCVPNPIESFAQLIALKANRILTSGQQEKAINGVELLKKLHTIANNQLIILPASGINALNVSVFKEAGFLEIHASASAIILKEKSIFFGNTPQTVSSIQNIKEILKIIKNA